MSSPDHSAQIVENSEHIEETSENLTDINISDEIVKMRMKLEQLRQKKQRKNAYNEQNGPGCRRRLENDETQRQNRQRQNKQIDKAFAAHDGPAAKKRIERCNQNESQRCIRASGIRQMDGLHTRDRLCVLLRNGKNKCGRALDKLRAQHI